MSEKRLDEMSDAEHDAWYAATFARVLATPPSCLRYFATARVDADSLGVNLDGHGEPGNAAFALACAACGGRQMVAIGHHAVSDHATGSDAKFIDSPLSARCVGCGRANVVFDGAWQGYNPAVCGDILGSPTVTTTGRGPSGPLVCEKCGGGTWQLTCRFEHSGEQIYAIREAADEGDAAVSAVLGREQDAFTWFTLVGDCAACGQPQTLAEFETA